MQPGSRGISAGSIPIALDRQSCATFFSRSAEFLPLSCKLSRQEVEVFT